MRYSINFYLGISDIKGNHYIYLRVRYAGRTMKLNIGLKTKKADWNTKQQMLKSSNENYWTYKEFLDKIRKIADTEMNSLLNIETLPTPTELKERINKALGKNKEPETVKTLIDYYNDFLEEQKKDWTTGTSKRYISFRNHLTQMQKEFNTILNFDNINDEFLFKFKDYFFESEGCLNSTVERYLKALKTFMNWSFKKKYHKNIDYMDFKFDYTTDSTIIYLSAQEREKLYYLDLSHNKRLEAIKDVFILGCYTGLRFSDLENLKPANVINDSLYFTAMKTAKEQVIPLNQYSRSIIKKYINTAGFLSVKTNQRTNDYLKELCELAQIDTPIIKVQFRRKERIETHEPKYKFVATHTARRTFGTLYLQDGGNINHLQKLFGHKNIDTTLKYLGVTAKDLKEDMKKVFADE